jgi:O-acetyl-ADP-ribose deacetylase (regulator of RNase III)
MTRKVILQDAPQSGCHKTGLIVGMGAAGLESILQLGERLYSTSPSHVDGVNFIYFDLDRVALDRADLKGQGWLTEKNFQFISFECSDLELQDQKRRIAGQRLTGWLDLRCLEGSLPSADNRLRARLAFFLRFDTWYRQIGAAIKHLPKTPDFICVLASAADGLGGVLVDATYSIRSAISRSSDRHIPYYGFVLLRPANEVEEANTYASLLELKYFQDTESVFDVRFSANSVRSINFNGPAFDRLYLFSEDQQPATGWIKAQLFSTGGLPERCPEPLGMGVSVCQHPGNVISLFANEDNANQVLPTLIEKAFIGLELCLCPEEANLLEVMCTLFANFPHDAPASRLKVVQGTLEKVSKSLFPTTRVVCQVEKVARPGEMWLVSEQTGFRWEDLTCLQNCYRAYDRLLRTGGYPVRLDRDNFGELRPRTDKQFGIRIERDSPCLVEVDLSGGERRIKLVSGPLAELAVDAIVLPRTRSLPAVESEPLANEVLQAGGEAIQAEVQRLIRKRDGARPSLFRGEWITTAGCLPAREIVHFAVVDDIYHQRPALENLEEGIKHILKYCSAHSYKTIAFPFVAAGAAVDKATSSIFKTIVRFMQNRSIPEIVILSVQQPEALLAFGRLFDQERDKQQPSPISETIINRYPFPIASAYRKFLHKKPVECDSSCWVELSAVLDRTLQLVCAIALSASLSLHNSPLGWLPAASNKKISLSGKGSKKIGSGDSLSLLKAAVHNMPAHAHHFPIRHLLDLMTYEADLDWMVTIRNDYSHKQAGIDLTDFENRLMMVLSALRWLEDYPLVVSMDEQQNPQQAYLLNGSDDRFIQLQIFSSTPLMKNYPAMINEASNEILFLYPFYWFDRCTDRRINKDACNKCPTPLKCDRRHLFTLEEAKDGGATYNYLDHNIQKKEAYGDLRALLDFSKDRIRLYQEFDFLRISPMD